MVIRKNFKIGILMFLIMILSACYNSGENNTTGTNSGETAETNAGNETSSNTGQEKTLRVAAANEIPTLRSNGSIDGLSATMLYNLFEGLYRFNENHEPTEGVAKDYEMNDDGKSYTFYLKENAVWSNGDPVTANDFIYAWKKANHPDTFSPHAYMMGPIKNAREVQNPESEIYGDVDKLGVEAVDEQTIKVELDDAVPNLLELMTHPVFYPQNEKFVEEMGDNYALEAENLVFNGPFVMESWTHDQGWVLKKNEDYWDADSVQLDKVDYKVIKDTSTEVNLYESNQLDVANLSSAFVEIYKDHDDFSTSTQTEVYFLRFNQKNEYLANVNIRKAIDMAWDKEQTSNNILQNGSIPAYWLTPPNYATTPDGKDFRDKYGDFNRVGLEEAKKVFEKGLEELGVEEISLELLSYDDEQRKSVAEFIKNQLEKNLPGLSITINQQPNKQKLDLEAKQSYDISHSGKRSNFSDPVEALEFLYSPSPYNWMDFHNEEYDNLVKNALVDYSNLEQRMSDLQEAERILVEQEAAISPMYQAGYARLINSKISGFVAHPNSTYSYKWVTID